MLKLRKEELDSLVCKTIYHYYLKNPLEFCFADDTKIIVAQVEIFKVYEEEPSCETSRQYIFTKDYKIFRIDVKDIGDPFIVAEDWYSFERNDELARKIFKAYENETYIRRCSSLINSLNILKSKHNITESMIQKIEIDDSMFEKIWNIPVKWSLKRTPLKRPTSVNIMTLHGRCKRWASGHTLMPASKRKHLRVKA